MKQPNSNDPTKAGKIRPVPLQDGRQEKCDRISLTECRSILCMNGAFYSDEEIELIRKVLYALAEVDYQFHQQTALNKQEEPPPNRIISFTSQPDDHDQQQKSHSLFPRKHRRAG